MTITIGTVRANARQVALYYAFSYAEGIFDGEAQAKSDRSGNWILAWVPEVELAAAQGDALSRITVRANAELGRNRWVKVDGLWVVDTSGVYHDALASAGFETTDALDAVAGVGQVGYTPAFPGMLRGLELGVYVQGGYQVKVMEPDTSGGRAAPGEGAVFRARARARFDERLLGGETRAIGVGLDGEAWYDFLDARFHYAVRGALRFFFAANKSIDITYERNSGAPAFEEGNQFGVGLTLELAD